MFKLTFWKRAESDELPKVQAPVAQEKQQGAKQVAQASIAQSNVQEDPSKTAKAWNWTKGNLPKIAFSVAVVAIGALLAAGLSVGATSPLAIAGYALSGATGVATGIWGYYRHKNATEIDRHIDRHAKEFYNVVKEFDDLNPSSNKYVTAKQKYLEAKQAIENDLINLNPADRDTFVKRIVLAAKSDNSFRINTQDERYDFKLEKSSVTFEEFVKAIVDNKFNDIQVSYDKALTSYAETFADALKKDMPISRKINHLINEAAVKIAGDKEYRLLNKQVPDVVNDLINKIKEKFGEKNIQNEIKKTDNLARNRYSFWRFVEGRRNDVRKDYGVKFGEKLNQINDLEKLLKDLDDAETGYEREKLSLLGIVRNTNNSKEKIRDAKYRIAEIDQRRIEINEQKEEKQKEIEKLKLELAESERKLGYEHLIDLNARRKELARLLGQELEDLELPEHPTLGDKFKYWTPRVASGAALTAGAITGAYYAWPYYGPQSLFFAGSAATILKRYATGSWKGMKNLNPFAKVVKEGPYNLQSDLLKYCPSGSSYYRVVSGQENGSFNR